MKRGLKHFLAGIVIVTSIAFVSLNCGPGASTSTPAAVVESGSVGWTHWEMTCDQGYCEAQIKGSASAPEGWYLWFDLAGHYAPHTTALDCGSWSKSDATHCVRGGGQNKTTDWNWSFNFESLDPCPYTTTVTIYLFKPGVGAVDSSTPSLNTRCTSGDAQVEESQIGE